MIDWLYIFNFSARTAPDYSKPAFNSMLVHHGKIVQTGNNLLIDQKSIKSINLDGAVIFPPFTDAHVHFLASGISKMGCDLSKPTTINEVLQSIEAEAAKSYEGPIIGWHFQESLLKEQKAPSLRQLNSISSKRIIWMTRADLHSAVVNSGAVDWANDQIIKSGRHYPLFSSDCSLINGSVYDFLAYRLIKEMTADFKTEAMRIPLHSCLRKGVATIHALEANSDTPEDALLVSNFLRQNRLHSVVYNQSPDPSLPVKQGWKQFGGCIEVDGSIGSCTAAMNNPYLTNSKNFGCLMKNKEDIDQLLVTGRKFNLQLAMHAIGDRALDTISQCYANDIKKNGLPNRPNRIEHCVLPTDSSIENALKAKAFICIQPVDDLYWGGPNNMYEKLLGHERSIRTNPFKTLLNAGLVLAAGSDSPVTPIDPILGIHALVNHHNPQERLDLNTALSLYITEPHKLSGESSERGFLKTGFSADFICLNKDPFTQPPQKIKDITVKAMYISGQPVFVK